MGTLFEGLNDELAGVVQSARRSVVQVRSAGRGIGAGVIWQSDGVIVTNAHVIRGITERASRGLIQTGHSIDVALDDGRVFAARVAAVDDDRDLAALAIDAVDLPAVQPGRARELQPGDWVFAVGHPWGVTHAATGGVIIRVGRGLPDLTVKGEYLVADLHLRPGNSGGPVVDAHGRMVGVSTLMTGLNVGVAVTVEQVREFMAQTQQRRATDLI